jgi:hypothetical protein
MPRQYFEKVMIDCKENDNEKTQKINIFECSKSDNNVDYTCKCTGLLSHTNYKIDLITKKTNFNDAIYNYAETIQTGIVFDK